MVKGPHFGSEDFLADIPPETMDRNPWLLYSRGQLKRGSEPETGTDYLTKAYELFWLADDQDSAGALLSWAAAADICLSEQGDLDTLQHWLERHAALRQRYPNHSSIPVEHQVTASLLGALLYLKPEDNRLDGLVAEAERVLQTSAEPHRHLHMAGHIIEYHLWRGETGKAKIAFDTCNTLIDPQTLPPAAQYNWQVLEAGLNLHCGAAADCLEAVSAWLKADKELTPRMHNRLCLLQAEAALLCDEPETADQALHALKLAGGANTGLTHLTRCRLATWVALYRGDIPVACEQCEQALELSQNPPTPYLQGLCHLARAHILASDGQTDAARHALEHTQELGQRMDSERLTYGYQIHSAWLCLRAGRQAQALTVLETAITLARRTGMLHWPWYQADMAEALFRLALNNGIETTQVQHMIRAIGLTPKNSPIDTPDWPMPVRITTLGQWHVTIDGQPMPMQRKPQQKPLELLKVLIAAGGHQVSQEHIIDALWPDAEGDVGGQAFATTLHRLRKLLHYPDAIQRQDAHISLNDTLCWTDVGYFEHILASHPSLPGGLPANASTAAIEQAIALYHGPFLGADCRSFWAVSMQERMRSKFLRQVMTLGKQREQAGDWEQATEWYLKGLEVDDLIEEFYLRLMHCHQQQGHRADAMLVYRRCCHVLEAGLGITPSVEIISLYSSLEEKAG